MLDFSTPKRFSNRLKMNRDKLFFRHVLLYYFDHKKTAAETHRLLSEVYGDEIPSEKTCRVWFERFRNGDFDNLEFLTGDYNSAKDSAATEQLSLEKIQENLTRLMKENASFDEICSWITANVGSREKDPKFIRHLMTAILETTLERHHGTWKLNLETFASLQTLIQRFVDANELLELQCLYAIQRYIKKIEFPPGTLGPIMNRLWMDNVISSDAFLTWQKKIPEGADVEGHSVSIVALTSFFTDLQEPDDNSSVEELSTSANQGC